MRGDAIGPAATGGSRILRLLHCRLAWFLVSSQLAREDHKLADLPVVFNLSALQALSLAGKSLIVTLLHFDRSGPDERHRAA